MAVKLRLMRMGKKKQPTYRIVAADSRSPRDGRFIEIVGTYAPRAEPSAIEVDNAKAVSWLSKGAQPTDTVRKLLEISGAWGEYAAGSPAAGKAAAKKKAPAAKAAAGPKAADASATAKATVKAAEPEAAEASGSEPEAAEAEAAE